MVLVCCFFLPMLTVVFYKGKNMDQTCDSSGQHDGARGCVICRNKVKPHPKVKDRQVTCGRLACRVARRISQQAQWRKKNPTYFRDRYEDVKRWRARHPDYQRKWRAQKKAQAPLNKPIVGEIQSQSSHIETASAWERRVPLSEIQSQLSVFLNKELSLFFSNMSARYNPT